MSIFLCSVFVRSVFLRRHEGASGTGAMQPLLCADSSKSELSSMDDGERGESRDCNENVDEGDYDDKDDDDDYDDDRGFDDRFGTKREEKNAVLPTLSRSYLVRDLKNYL